MQIDDEQITGLPESTLHDRIYEIFSTCYSPEASPGGDVKEQATQDILRIIAQQREQVDLLLAMVESTTEDTPHSEMIQMISNIRKSLK